MTPRMIVMPGERLRLPAWLPVLLVLCLLLGLRPAQALMPPDAAEIERLRASGELAGQSEAARATGNHRLDPATIPSLTHRLGQAAGGVGADAPPPAWRGGLPATGSPRVLVLLIDFADQPHVAANTPELIAERMFGPGGEQVAGYPYESLRGYYLRSSYGKLDIRGHVTPWYRARYNRAHYQSMAGGAGMRALVDEALEALKATGHGLAQYDNDGDGNIDTLFVKWAGPAGSWASFWWAQQTWYGSSRQWDGKGLRKIVWSWAGGNYNRDPLYEPRVDIHETGHALGLPDYYDYNDAVGPRGGAGWDMMHNNSGDHSAFSKFVLGWITPKVVTSGSQAITLKPSGSAPDAVIFMPGAASGQAFSEYFLAHYRRLGAGNDAGYMGTGISLWHVDARLDSSGWNYLNDNSTSAQKLLAPVEADGLEQIAQGGAASAADLYTAATQFGPATRPASVRNDGRSTGAAMTGIGVAGATIAATFSVQAKVAITLARSGSGAGSVSAPAVGLNCGSACSASVEVGSRVTLVAQAAAGSRFVGWSGACSGTASSCVITPQEATRVGAVFDLPQYGLEVVRTGTGQGTVKATAAGGIDCGRTCAARYTAGTKVTLSAVADAKSVFAGWAGACSGTGLTCTVTMSEARGVRAQFAPRPYLVTVKQAGSPGNLAGLPAGVSCRTGCSVSLPAGSTLTLKAVPVRGQRFAGWGGACLGQGACTIAVDAAKSVTAVFVGP
ncbi:MAG: hypothetical protein QG612_1722 [Pseudomonadota bacterium]|nr:hypothetical protein [Pseudomonadota bacterium]